MLKISSLHSLTSDLLDQTFPRLLRRKITRRNMLALTGGALGMVAALDTLRAEPGYEQDDYVRDADLKTSLTWRRSSRRSSNNDSTLSTLSETEWLRRKGKRE